MKRIGVLTAISIMSTVMASAQHSGPSPHAGKQAREIASLSQQDIAAIRAGTGWGLALPAEINDTPGPRHVLDLAEPLALTESQIAQITDIFDTMKRSAIDAGEDFIAAEKRLNDAFVRGGLDEVTLERLVSEAGKTRAALRMTHLKAHLETRPLLTDEQVKKYALLRGYADSAADPCAAVPKGHDPVMWRKHNGCESQ